MEGTTRRTPLLQPQRMRRRQRDLSLAQGQTAVQIVIVLSQNLLRSPAIQRESASLRELRKKYIPVIPGKLARYDP